MTERNLFEEKLNILKKQVAEKELDKRKKLLAKLGFVKKIYINPANCPAEYDSYELKSGYDENKEYRYYVEVPIDVSDEEYAEILRQIELDTDKGESVGGGVATAMQVIAVLIYLFFGVIGLLLLFDSVLTGILVIATGFISGTVFLGFAQIISLLHSIDSKLK